VQTKAISLFQFMVRVQEKGFIFDWA